MSRSSRSMIDCVYVAASALDARFTRTCVASVRSFYPEIPIRLLVGGRLQRRLEHELRRHWGIRIADFPQGDYGWGFVKLEPLFGTPGERFLILDSDTVLTGPVLDDWKGSDAPFLVDNEKYSEEQTKVYYDWRRVREIDPTTQRPLFLFNTGQWLGTSGVLHRDDFAPWIEWTFPRKARHPECFFNGEQGILNYVLNQKALLGGLRVECRAIMRWPGKGLQGLEARAIAERTAASVIIHWAGMGRVRQRHVVGADVLAYFEEIYYERLPFGRARRIVATWQNSLTNWLDGVRVRVRLRLRMIADTPLVKRPLRAK